MSSPLPNLSSRLTVNTQQFRAALASARRAVGDFGRTASRELGGVAKGLAKIATGIPALTTATAALGGFVAAAGAAGVAAGAFAAAVGPQVSAMQESSAAADKLATAQETAARKQQLAEQLRASGSDLATKAEKAATTARLAAADAALAYKRQTAGMPKATADAALSMAKLKSAHKQWSNSLAGDTMPVFTKGLDLVRKLLPKLTPLVKAASTAFSGLLDDLDAATDGPGFDKWIADMAKSAGPAITNLGKSIGNVFRGIGGLMQAFSGESEGVTAGLLKMTDAFADWATQLKDSEGFAKFLENAENGGGMLAKFGEAIFNLVVALGPILGATILLADAFATLINNTPEPVLKAIAIIVTTLTISLKLFAVATRIVTVATKAWAAAQKIANVVMKANPLVRITGLIILLVGAIVLAYQKSETFRAIVQAVWSAVKTAISTAIDGIKAAINWFAELPGRIGGWFGDAKDAAVDKMGDLLSWLRGLPGRVGGALSGLGSTLWDSASDGFQSFRDAAGDKVSDLLDWARGLPGDIARGIGDLGGLLYDAGTRLIQGLIDGIQNKVSSLTSKLSFVTDLIPDWKGPAEKDARLLTPAGASIMDGLMRGIQARLPDLRAQLAGVTAEINGMGARPVIPSGRALSAVAGGGTTVNRTIAPTIHLHGTSVSAGAISSELEWLGKVGG